MGSIAALILVLILFSDFVTAYIPYSWEKKISDPFTSALKAASDGQLATDANPVEPYLQQLAGRLSVAQGLPEDMVIKVHYLDKDTVNAYATLDGHVFFYRGLLEKLPNENALSMLLAHEIAHVKYRHPIRSLSRGVLAGLVLSIVSSSAGDAIMQNVINEGGMLTILKYSRDMERQADDEALQSVKALYGHTKGSADLFRALQQKDSNFDLFEFYELFSTHPLTESRIDNIRVQSKQFDAAEGITVTPLPEGFHDWLK